MEISGVKQWMPTQKEAYFEGRMGPLIFYKRLGQNCIRSVPHEVRQNNATKSSAFVFGRASKMAKNFRKHLLPIIPFPGDIKMQNRLISTIYKWIHSDRNAQEDRIHTTDLFRNFLFTNEGNAFKKRCKIKTEVKINSEGLLQIYIPPFIPVKSISAPMKTISVKLKLAAAACDPDNGWLTGSGFTELIFPYDSTPVTEQIISMPFPKDNKSLVLTGASLEYMVSKSFGTFIIRKKTFRPSGIISAMLV